MFNTRVIRQGEPDLEQRAEWQRADRLADTRCDNTLAISSLA